MVRKNLKADGIQGSIYDFMNFAPPLPESASRCFREEMGRAASFSNRKEPDFGLCQATVPEIQNKGPDEVSIKFIILKIKMKNLPFTVYQSLIPIHPC